MNKVEQYRVTLRTLDDWLPFLLEESGLPGPRANLELIQVVAEKGDERLFWQLLSVDADKATANTPYEFLVVCGVVGLGKLLCEGRVEVFETLRIKASDPRWRIREGVAMALQLLGDHDMGMLLQEMERWAKGNMLEKRAVAAALCEPRLLRRPEDALTVLRLLDEITASLCSAEDRKIDDFRVLRQGLGYCWSVAVCALPEEGKRAMERWLSSQDKDIAWVMRENLKKKRLVQMDAQWLREWQGRARSLSWLQELRGRTANCANFQNFADMERHDGAKT